MATKQKASKAYYDLGATARHFRVGDKGRMHLKSMGRRKGKLDAAWSAPMDILAVRGAVLTLGNPGSHKTITIHSDKTIPLTPGLRPEHLLPAHPAAVETADSEPVEVVDGDGLDAVDQVEPVDYRLEELDFLSQPRAEGKRQPKLKSFSSNLCIVGMMASSTQPPSSQRFSRNHPPPGVDLQE